MKLRRLPPLHALEAFEVAARELSFRKAAEALHLTPSAVSHQIKGLEEFLGFALFRRLNRALELTEGGRDYLNVVQASLEALRAGSERSRQHHGRRAMLKISASPYLASEIMLPALPSFQREHPQIELNIETRVQAADLRREDLDLAVRFGGGPWAGLNATRLLEVEAVPVCSPALAATLRGRGPDELAGISLIHSTPLPESWPQWARLSGATLGTPTGELWLDSYIALLRAAEQGLGVALGMTPVINPWLRAGRLALPWPQLRARIPQAYYLVHRPGDEARHEVRVFAAWLSALLNHLPEV